MNTVGAGAQIVGKYVCSRVCRYIYMYIYVYI